MNESPTRSFWRIFHREPGVPLIEALYQAFFSAVESRGTSNVVTVLACFVIAGSCFVSLRLGLPHMSIYGHDIFTLLDGSWRVAQGEAPHVDFYSAFGPVFYFVQASGLLLSHYRIEGLVYGTVVAGLVLGVWSLVVIRARLNAFSAVVCIAFLVLFWLAPFPIGEPYYLPSYAMQYNRLGYVLLFVIILELFGSAEHEKAQWDWGGVSTGVALACLLFMKANFFAVGAAITLGAYATKIKRARHGSFLAAGFLIAFCGFASYLHWQLGAVWHDLRIAAGARQTRFDQVKDSVRTLVRNATAIVTLVGLALLARVNWTSRNSGALPCLNRTAAISLMVLGADIVLCLSNQQRFGFPLTTIAIILFVDQMCRTRVREGSEERLGPVPALVLVMLATVLPFIAETVNAWAIQVTMRQNAAMATAARINAAPMANFIFDDHVDPVWGQSEANGHLLVNRVNNGLSLLRQYSAPSDRIACLCYANPFTYPLLRRPIEGGAAFFDYGTNFTERFAPSAERILGNADVVIYPKAEANSRTVRTLLSICREILSTRYRVAAESQDWVLLKKL